ncbi:MAG: MBL fold metallo-hydrolase [Candidatus Daviesbacteria bacterium]|nr:MBL fold metallo-hydrolase [Candidatus Daviesbacteria bacterium]
MKILSLTVGQVRTNCYLIESDGEVGIIDPGDDADFIIRKITDSGAKPVWILSTHGHFDHVLAVSELALTYQIPYYLNPKDNFLLKRAKETAEHFLKISVDPILTKPKYFSSASQAWLGVGKLEFKIIETPGHSQGGICLYCQKEKVIFTGDTLFARGLIGKTTMQYCSQEDLEKSLEKIFKLPAETLLYPGHGEESTLGKTKKEYIQRTKNPAHSGIS